MAIRNQKILNTTNLILHDVQGGNPSNAQDDGGALENGFPWKGKIVRVTYPPSYLTSSAASTVWRLIPFQFTRDAAVEQQLIIIKENGKTYKMQGGEMEQDTACPATWVRKPSSAVINNRLHLSDGTSYYIWDGWTWVIGGLSTPSADIGLTFSGTGLTGTYAVVVTAVHIRSNNGTDVRVHESTQCAVNAAVVPANQGIVITKPSVFDSRATHWSIYMSEVSGSSVYRRVTTVSKNTASYTITAEPSSTAPVAPVRNDPVQPSRILTVWKQRLASRSEAYTDQFWFTAFGEVNGGLNGAGEESIPGRGARNAFGTYGTSVSDLVNSWNVSDGGRPIQNAVYHDDFLFIFTDKTGFVIIGDGAVLDNIGSRDFTPKRQFPYGAAGPFASCSTPKGLVTLTPDHKLWLWPGSGESIDIGIDIQKRLDALTAAQMADLEMLYWNGNGHNWLMLTLPDRIQVFDFDVKTEQYPYGIWFSIGSQSALPQPTSLCIWNPDGEPVLLSGHSDGSVHQLLDVCQPAHLGLSASLGFCYLGATVQNSPTFLARTGPIGEDDGKWVQANYFKYYHIGTGDSSSISTTNPTITAYYDTYDPSNPVSGVTLTSATMPISNERRAWYAPSGGSGAGVLCDSFQTEVKWTTTNTDGQSRPQLINNELWEVGVSTSPRSEFTY